MTKEKRLMVRRECAGVYYYWLEGDESRQVCVNKIDGNPAYGDPKFMWIAVAEWRNDAYSDPVDTKREAVSNVRPLLEADHFKAGFL